MSHIPSNRYLQAKGLRAEPEKAPVVAGVPTPSCEDFLPGQIAQVVRLLPVDIRDEIGSEAEIMRTLEYPRFRSAFFEQVKLPAGVAESLEEFEAGLRLAGFIASDQVLCQTLANPTKFRVQKRGVAVDSHIVSPLQARRLGRAQF